MTRRLTLMAAPAGFGKTTLLSEWGRGLGRPVAWLSLDAGDTAPAQFLRYVVAALQIVEPTLGAGLTEALQASVPPPIETVLTALLNQIAAHPQPLVLILDDYHLVESAAVDQALTFLLEHLPPHLHVVIATREDPALPLARLRAQAHLTELRAADLRFTPGEAAEFLGQVMGLTLTAADQAALDGRTEGWIAGLQLAALSMQGRTDVSGFIAGFAGNHRYIVDYLVEEVLRHQPEAIRTFLLQTSILGRLHGPLCEAVTAQEHGAARLQALERGNYFVVPLDDQRQWYRYHHLFADVLSAQLLAEQPALVPELHRRASDWYDRAGFTGDAITHALAAQAFDRAADLIERALPAMRRGRQEGALMAWLQALPDPVVRRRPVLCVHLAGGHLLAGHFKGAKAHLLEAERWLETPSGGTDPLAGMVVVDDEEFQGLAGQVAIFRAGLALAEGDVAGTLHHAGRVLDLVPVEDHLRRGSAAGFLGLAHWTLGDLEAALRWYREGRTQLERAGFLADAVGCALALADLEIAQGRLRDARVTYEQGVDQAIAAGRPPLRGAADMHVGLCGLALEQGALEAAAAHLQASQGLGEVNGLPQNPYRWHVAMARLREAHGDLNGALALLEEAERRYVGDFFPNARPIAALRARVWIRQERWEDVLAWARGQGLSAQDDVSYLREFEHITLVRLLLVQGTGESTGFLTRLLHAAENGGRTSSVIELLTLQAVAHQRRGDLSAALVALERALTLAQPEGYVRTFVIEGPPMATLLRVAARRGILPEYSRHLQRAFQFADPSPARQGSFEALTGRELEVLRLLQGELAGPEIARRLGVSLNTLRTHTKSIYSKLGVSTRRAALRRAGELDLL